MRGSCQNGDCDRPGSEYRDEFGQYLCDECYASWLHEQDQEHALALVDLLDAEIEESRLMGEQP